MADLNLEELNWTISNKALVESLKLETVSVDDWSDKKSVALTLNIRNIIGRFYFGREFDIEVRFHIS